MLPGVDLGAALVENPSNDPERVVAEQEERRRLGGRDRGDDGLRGLVRVAGLGAVDGVVLLASLAGGVGVVGDRRGSDC